MFHLRITGIDGRILASIPYDTLAKAQAGFIDVISELGPGVAKVSILKPLASGGGCSLLALYRKECP